MSIISIGQSVKWKSHTNPFPRRWGGGIIIIPKTRTIKLLCNTSCYGLLVIYQLRPNMGILILFLHQGSRLCLIHIDHVESSLWTILQNLLTLDASQNAPVSLKPNSTFVMKPSTLNYSNIHIGRDALTYLPKSNSGRIQADAQMCRWLVDRESEKQIQVWFLWVYLQTDVFVDLIKCILNHCHALWSSQKYHYIICLLLILKELHVS